MKMVSRNSTTPAKLIVNVRFADLQISTLCRRTRDIPAPIDTYERGIVPAGWFVEVRVIRVFLILVCFATGTAAAKDAVTRTDFFVASDPGLRIFVREVRPQEAKGVPVLLIHGARVPGIGSFDLPVPGGSLAQDIALTGHAVYVMDVRGYGKSSRGPEFSKPPEGHPPLVRSNEAVRDIAAVVSEIRRRWKKNPVLFGWSTGGHWAGYFASLYSDRISAVILHNTIVGVDAPQKLVGRGSDLQDPSHPGQFNYKAVGAYRCSTAESLIGVWDRNIPIEDKPTWRDPAIAKAYVDEALKSDPEGAKRNPPCMRSPNGAMEDSFYSAVGRQFWDASLITVPVLITAGEYDFWSRTEDRERLQEELVHSPAVRIVVIPRATHFVHLDRAEHGRAELLRALNSFLQDLDNKR